MKHALPWLSVFFLQVGIIYVLFWTHIIVCSLSWTSFKEGRHFKLFSEIICIYVSLSWCYRRVVHYVQEYSVSFYLQKRITSLEDSGGCDLGHF